MKQTILNFAMEQNIIKKDKIQIFEDFIHGLTFGNSTKIVGDTVFCSYFKEYLPKENFVTKTRKGKEVYNSTSIEGTKITRLIKSTQKAINNRIKLAVMSNSDYSELLEFDRELSNSKFDSLVSLQEFLQNFSYLIVKDN